MLVRRFSRAGARDLFASEAQMREKKEGNEGEEDALLLFSFFVELH